MKTNKLNNWLDSKTIFKNETPPTMYYSTYTKDAYYSDSKNDSDLKYLNKKFIDQENEYYVDHIYIDPNTNRYHANLLFRMMVDYSYENNFDYELHDPETGNVALKFNLMDKELKQSFYKFCYENT
ncbi:hypothetical protein Indivirus_1_70 [Indivirus ILV1]|uniref:Uncharacterized protein n=1 Tax=Indivirus ILV1 TaxID=1977633 RepID=A0A1V0SCK2_9VIRU|nr:hypothetical protein Indivirus_1_70 [Indivirus ILV1]